MAHVPRRVPALVLALAAALLAGVARTPPVSFADEPDRKRIPDDLQPVVRAAVEKARAFLRENQRPDGAFPWTRPSADAQVARARAWDGGLTCLATLALARAGARAADPEVAKALEFVRAAAVTGERPGLLETTYGAGAFLWMLSEVRPGGFRGEAARAVVALDRGAGDFHLWGYEIPRVSVTGDYLTVEPGGMADRLGDLSNTQFAVLGLLAAERLGLFVPDAPWLGLEGALVAHADRQGGFGYRFAPGEPAAFLSAGSSTTAVAATNLYLCARRRGLPHARAIEQPAVRKALGWLGRHSPLRTSPVRRLVFRNDQDVVERPPYYELLALERLGAFTGIARLAGMEWYREGANHLLALQAADGGWPAGTGGFAANGRVQNTAFAVLFLTRASTGFEAAEPGFGAADLARSADVPNPLFHVLVVRGVRDFERAAEGERLAWRRAFVACGARVLGELLKASRSGPTTLRAAASVLLRELSGRASAGAGAVDDWEAWLRAYAPRLRPSTDGARFEVVE